MFCKTLAALFFSLPSVCAAQVSGQILYVKYAAPNWSIWVMNASGSNSRLLAQCYQAQCYPNWSPDGSRIVFQRQVPNGVAVFTMNADGSNQAQLTPFPSLPYSGDTLPSWTPDGRILFSHVPNPNNAQLVDIDIMNADGSGLVTVLPAGSGPTLNIEPRMRADGTIVFMQNATGSSPWQIWTMSSTGTNLTQITNELHNHGDPMWSPDGTKIAFGSDRAGPVNVFIMNADGSDIQQLTQFSSPYEGGDTGWSPDGKYIAFERDVNGNGQSNPNAQAQVWIVPTDGSRAPWTTHASCAGVNCSPRFKP
jgi:TolB protein